MLRPTRRGFGLLFAVLPLLFIGTNAQAGWLFVLAALVGGAAVAGILLPPFMVRGLRVERESPPEVMAGEAAPVTLILRNASRSTKLSLLVRDQFLGDATSFVPTLSGHEQVRLPGVRPPARRGVYEGTPVTISSSAPFGALRARRTIPVEGRSIVLPRIVPIEWLPALATATKPLDSASQRAQRGIGHDFLGIREFVPGDSLRHVHWPTTARTGTIMVKEFEQETPRRMGAIVDTWADLEAGIDGSETGKLGADGTEASVLDTMCTTAASVAALAAMEHHPCSIVAPVAGAIDGVADGSLEESLTWLAGLKAPGGIDLATALPRARAELGRIDTLAILAGTWGPNARLAERIDALGEDDTQIIVVLVDVTTFGPPIRTQPHLARQSAEALIKDLAARHVAVYLVHAREDLQVCLQTPFAA